MPAADYADQDEDGGGEDVDQPGGAKCCRHGATKDGATMPAADYADQDDQDEDGGVQDGDSGGGGGGGGEDDVD